jgi:hypothetical protein
MRSTSTESCSVRDFGGQGSARKDKASLPGDTSVEVADTSPLEREPRSCQSRGDGVKTYSSSYIIGGPSIAREKP